MKILEVLVKLMPRLTPFQRILLLTLTKSQIQVAACKLVPIPQRFRHQIVTMAIQAGIIIPLIERMLKQMSIPAQYKAILSHKLHFLVTPTVPDLEDTIHVGKNCVPEVEKASLVTSSHGEELQFLSGGDVWQPLGGIRQSYIGHQAYTPSGGLSIIHHPEGGEDEKNGFIHLEEVNGRKMLQPKANNSFGSFPNNNQNELLQSLFKGHHH